jgi:diguanylate cyclase (GGDEF)-like protein
LANGRRVRRDGRAAKALTGVTDEVRYESEDRTHDPDQPAADLDKTPADSDERVPDREQRLSDQDRVPSDRDLAPEGSGAADRQTSRFQRKAASRERASRTTSRARTTAEQRATAKQRDDVARACDLSADARDRTALARDEAAEARDTSAAQRERHALEELDLGDATAPLRALWVSIAVTRRQGALERRAAAEDRAAAAADRQRAMADRDSASLDDLTGLFRRGPGELALSHEIARSHRLGPPLVLAMIDVDGLKAVNDTNGHAAGDALLSDVAAAITSTMRAYDVTVRWGGDEFVCALYDLTVEVASHRLAEIRTALEALSPEASISAGLARLVDDDTLESLVARADANLYRTKANREN